MDSQQLHVLADHYQKTYELNHELWKERNRLFLSLLAVIGIAALLSYKVSDTETLIVGFVVSLLNIDATKTPVDELQRNFPFALLQVILMLVMLYLMVNLYQRSVTIIRNYRYLGQIEDELRPLLGLPANSVFFTREGSHYAQNETWLQKWLVKMFYGLALAGLLGVFFYRRITEDWSISRELAIVEMAIGLIIAVFFVGYALPHAALPKFVRPKPTT